MILADKFIFPSDNLMNVRSKLKALGSEDDTHFLKKYSSAFAQITQDGNLVALDTITKCRESFFYYFYPGYKPTDSCAKLHFRDKWCFFQYKPNVKVLDKFISIVEKMLDVPKEHRTNFAYSNDEAICIVFPSKFWTSDWMRYGFFTLFLRCASDFYITSDKSDIFPGLNRYHLTKNNGVNLAIRHFLKGNTKPTFDLSRQGQYVGASGVVYTFNNKNQQEIDKLLVKPTGVYF